MMMFPKLGALKNSLDLVKMMLDKTLKWVEMFTNSALGIKPYKALCVH